MKLKVVFKKIEHFVSFFIFFDIQNNQLAKYQTYFMRRKLLLNSAQKDVFMPVNSKNQKSETNANKIILGKNSHIEPADIKGSVLVFGKNKFVENIVKPNIMQMPGSMIINDLTGDLYKNYAKLLKDGDYNVKLFSTDNYYPVSSEYNPISALISESGFIFEPDVIDLVHTLVSIHESSFIIDPVQAGYTETFISACILMILRFYPKPLHNLVTVAEMIKRAATRDDYREFRTELEEEFEKMRTLEPDALCFRYYDEFYLAGREMYDETVRLAMYMLSPFERDPYREIIRTAYDVKARNLRDQIMTYRKDDDGNMIVSDSNIIFNRDNCKKKFAVFVNAPDRGNDQYDCTNKFLRVMLTKYAIDNHSVLCEPISSGNITTIFANIEDLAHIPNIMQIPETHHTHPMCIIANVENEYDEAGSVENESILLENRFAYKIGLSGFVDTEAFYDKIGIEINSKRSVMTLYDKKNHPNYKNTGECDPRQNYTEPIQKRYTYTKDLSPQVKQGMIASYRRALPMSMSGMPLDCEKVVEQYKKLYPNMIDVPSEIRSVFTPVNREDNTTQEETKKVKQEDDSWQGLFN